MHMQVNAKAESENRTKRDNVYVYETFKAGIAAGQLYDFDEAAGVLDRAWKKP